MAGANLHAPKYEALTVPDSDPPFFLHPFSPPPRREGKKTKNLWLCCLLFLLPLLLLLFQRRCRLTSPPPHIQKGRGTRGGRGGNEEIFCSSSSNLFWLWAVTALSLSEIEQFSASSFLPPFLPSLLSFSHGLNAGAIADWKEGGKRGEVFLSALGRATETAAAAAAAAAKAAAGGEKRLLSCSFFFCSVLTRCGETASEGVNV